MAYTPVGPFTNNAPPALDETTMDHLEAGIVGAHADLAGKADTSHTHAASDLTATGTRDGTTFLRGDNTWAVPAGGGGAVDSVNGETGAVVLDPDDLDDTSTTNKFATAAQLSKIDGVEAGADVTDTANVTAAGALMDSEVTNLADVKAFNPADYATAAQGSTADSAVQPGDDADTLGSGAAADNTVLAADGAGGAAWEVPFDPYADQNIVIDGVDGDFYWRGSVVTGRPSGLPALTKCIWNTQRDPGFTASDFTGLSPAPASYDGWVEYVAP